MSLLSIGKKVERLVPKYSNFSMKLKSIRRKLRNFSKKLRNSRRMDWSDPWISRP